MTNQYITFEGGIQWITVFLIVAVVQAATGNVVSVWELGPTIPIVTENAISTLIDLAFLGIVWWIVRAEGVRFGDIGLSSTLVGPAILTVAVFYLALNGVGVGLALATADLSIIGYQWTEPPVVAIGEFLFGLVFVSLIEEIAFRGYVQSKCIALLGDDTHLRIGLGIVGASVLFAAIHFPRILTAGVPGSQELLTYVGLLLFSGITFGVLYEVTQNLYIPILIHAAGNMPGTIGIRFFDPSGLPFWATILYLGTYLALFVVMIAGYRWWAFKTERMPVWTGRKDADRTLIQAN